MKKCIELPGLAYAVSMVLVGALVILLFLFVGSRAAMRFSNFFHDRFTV